MKNTKILIVDDEKQMLTLLKLELGSHGFDIHTAEDGASAIQKAKTIQPEVILIDIMLPDMSGADTIRKLHLDASTKNIPVLFLTALLSKEEEQESKMINIEGQDYHTIAKPFQPDHLLMMINRALNR